MYRIFCQNTKNFFIINQEGNENDFRIKIAQPLKGLADISLYKKWRIEDREKFDEVNNIVYEINNNKDKFHSFKTFSWELWGYDFEANMSSKCSRDIVEEQLELVNLLLGTQYWVDLGTEPK